MRRSTTASRVLKVHEWMEFTRPIVGADHFYLFLHVLPGQGHEAELRWFWERVAAPFVSVYRADSRTLMEDWAQRYDARFGFQTSVLNSCVCQFGCDNELMLAIDIDEWMVPPARATATHSPRTRGAPQSLRSFGCTAASAPDTSRRSGRSARSTRRARCARAAPCPTACGPCAWRDDARKVAMDPDAAHLVFVHYVYVSRTTRRGCVDDAHDVFGDDDHAAYERVSG